MAVNAKIVQLRELIQRHVSAPSRRSATPWPTGVVHLDEALGGGLPKGGIVELTSEFPSSGSSSLVLEILRHAAQVRRWTALIDGRDSFDPQSAGADVLASLLWIRCHDAAEAIRSADLLLRDGNLPLVVLDLRSNTPGELRKIPETTWYRLQRAIEPTSATMVAMTARPLIVSADARLAVEAHFDLGALEQERPDLLQKVKLRITRKRSRAAAPQERLADVS